MLLNQYSIKSTHMHKPIQMGRAIRFVGYGETNFENMLRQKFLKFLVKKNNYSSQIDMFMQSACPPFP